MPYAPNRKTTEFNVQTFGAAGDGTTNDTAAIQAAIDAAEAVGGTVTFPAGTYQIHSSLTSDATVTLIGQGAILRAAASMTQILSLTAGRFRLENLHFSGQNVVDYCLHTNARVSAKNCFFIRGNRDGVFCPNNGNTDFSVFDDCIFEENGTTYYSHTDSSTYGLSGDRSYHRQVSVSGTVATTAGGNMITGTGTSFTTLGLRRGDIIKIGTAWVGYDHVLGATGTRYGTATWAQSSSYPLNYCVFYGGNQYKCIQAGTSSSGTGPTGTDPTAPITDGTCQWRFQTPSEVFVIANVNSDTQIQIETYPGTAFTRSGIQYQIGRGSGFYETSYNDNNISTLRHCLFRNNAANGARICGLYGSRLYQPQCDYNSGFAVSIGVQGLENVLGCKIQDIYSEENGAIRAIHCGNVLGLTIENALSDTKTVWVTHGSWNFGTITGDIADGNMTGNETRPICDYTTAAGTLGAWNNTLDMVPSKRLAPGCDVIYSVNHRHSTFVGTPTATAGNVSTYGNTLTPSDGTGIMRMPSFQGGGWHHVTGTPSFTDGTVIGQEMIIRETDMGFAVTLRDESVLTGSKLRLKTPTAYIAGRGALCLWWDGLVWRENWRSAGVTDGSVEGVPDGAGDSTATPGNATLNTMRGRSAIALGASSVTINNNLVTATSIVHAVIQESDATLTQILRVVPTAGSFTITGNANATSDTNVAWFIITSFT